MESQKQVNEEGTGRIFLSVFFVIKESSAVRERVEKSLDGSGAYDGIKLY